jgi:hypothetical protein
MGFSIIPEDVPPEHGARWLAATKVQAADWPEENAVFLPTGEQTTLEEIREFYEGLAVAAIKNNEPMPTWVWGSQEVPFEFDAEEMLIEIFDDLDSFPKGAVDDLQSKLNQWTNQHAVGLFMDVLDQRVVVMLPASWWNQS